MNPNKEFIQAKAASLLSLKAIGIIGVSGKSNKFGNMIFKELIKKNINIYQIHNSIPMLNDAVCYKSTAEAPEKIEGLIINVQRSRVLDIVKDNYQKGITQFWIQQGSQSKEVIEFCNNNQIDAIHGKCILMFAEPVSSIHKFHNAIWKWFG